MYVTSVINADCELILNGTNGEFVSCGIVDDVTVTPDGLAHIQVGQRTYIRPLNTVVVK